LNFTRKAGAKAPTTNRTKIMRRLCQKEFDNLPERVIESSTETFTAKIRKIERKGNYEIVTFFHPNGKEYKAELLK